MKLSTGKIAIPIEFDNGDVQNIYFNPNDMDIILRMNEAQEKINEQIETIDDFELNRDGTPKDKTNIELFKKIREIICNEVDRIFGGDVSSVAFKYCHPLAIIEGKRFIHHFFEYLLPKMKLEIEAEHKRLLNRNEHMLKHVEKYIK